MLTGGLLLLLRWRRKDAPFSFIALFLILFNFLYHFLLTLPWSVFWTGEWKTPIIIIVALRVGGRREWELDESFSNLTVQLLPSFTVTIHITLQSLYCKTFYHFFTLKLTFLCVFFFNEFSKRKIKNKTMKRFSQE